MHDAATSHAQGGRPKLEVADIFRAFGEEYRRSRPITLDQERVMRDIERCRTAALGGHVEVCNHCGFSRPCYNSCRNRHCPKCQGLEQARWIEARKERVLPVRHFHVVFTLPAELRPLALANRKVLFDLLFAASAQTLLEFSANPKWIGGQPGLSVILHTWARDLSFHPHAHCVISDGGLTGDGSRWLSARGKGKFIFPVKALSKVFRAKFLAGLARANAARALVFAGGCAALADPLAFSAFKGRLAHLDWVVYAKRPFREAEHVFEYLGRYTHRVGISNHRLVSMSPDHVVFRRKGSETVCVDPLEFIRRFLLHVLPRGFIKIRHYGLYASGNVGTRLEAARRRLTGPPVLPANDSPPGDEPPADWRDFFVALTGIDLRRCPRCGLGLMIPEPSNVERTLALQQLADPAPPAG